MVNSMTARRSRSPVLIWATLSLLCHSVIAISLWKLSSAPSAPWSEESLANGSLVTFQAYTGEPSSHLENLPLLLPGGKPSVQNVDTPHFGRGGTQQGTSEIVLLVSQTHLITLQDSLPNSPRLSQIQRIQTSAMRASWENRRATPNPRDEPFLASGEGAVRERRRESDESTRSGIDSNLPASSSGNASQNRSATEEIPQQEPSFLPTPAEQGSFAHPHPGVLQGQGSRAQNSADVAHGCPPVDEGPAATPSQTAGRVQDNTNAELLAARLLQSTVDASQRQGRELGEGRGGLEDGASLGSSRPGRESGHAAHHSPGPGQFPALDTSDPRYRRWYLRLRRQVENTLRFPRARAIAMDQGFAVFRLQVHRSGRLASAPQRIRSTGFDDMDQEALRAIEHVTPFAPLPSDLVPHQPSIRFDLMVEFSNPMVGH